MPLISAAAAGCLVDVILLLVLPRTEDASSFAVAQTGAYVAALAALVFVASLSKPQWPSLRDIVATVLATMAMAAALLPLRERDPGFETLVEQIMAGTVIYSFFVASFDIAGLRTILYAKLRAHVAGLQLP